MIDYDSFSRCYLTDIFFAIHAGAKELNVHLLIHIYIYRVAQLSEDKLKLGFFSNIKVIKNILIYQMKKIFLCLIFDRVIHYILLSH